MSLSKIIILAFASWRLSNLLVNEEGPGKILHKFRKLVGVYYDEWSDKKSDNLVGSLFICVWCMAVWISFIFVYSFKWRVFRKYMVSSFAVSGLVILIHETIQRIRR